MGFRVHGVGYRVRISGLRVRYIVLRFQEKINSLVYSNEINQTILFLEHNNVLTYGSNEKISDEEIKEISEYSKRKQEISIDLPEQKIFFGNKEIKFEIDSFKKKCLLEGLDDIALSLEKEEKIFSFEKNLKNQKPWIFND